MYEVTTTMYSYKSHGRPSKIGDRSLSPEGSRRTDISHRARHTNKFFAKKITHRAFKTSGAGPKESQALSLGEGQRRKRPRGTPHIL